MTPIVAKKIEAYARRHTTRESRLLKRLARETRTKTARPQMQTGHLEGAFLRLLVRLAKARRVLEIGTFTGYSALAMAEGLPPGGRLTTLDLDPETTAIARRFWARSAHGGKIRLLLGPALRTLRTLRGPFDLVFIDADKTNYARYWDACLPKLRRGGIIAVDNVLWSGRVLAPKDRDGRAIAAFNRRAARDRRVELAMLTVRDGVTLAYKR